MKRRTCQVAERFPTVDIAYDGILFSRAALAGDGGVMGEASVDGWMDIATRFRQLRDRRAMLTIYPIKLDGPPWTEQHDVPASACSLLAVYAPTRRNA